MKDRIKVAAYTTVAWMFVGVLATLVFVFFGAIIISFITFLFCLLIVAWLTGMPIINPFNGKSYRHFTEVPRED